MDETTKDYREQVEAILDDILGLEDAISALRTKIEKEVLVEAAGILDDEQSISLARYLYFRRVDFSSNAIARGLFGDKNSSRMINRVGDFEMEIECDHCGKKRKVSSRFEMEEALKGGKNYAEGKLMLCRPCEKQMFHDRSSPEEHAKWKKIREKEISRYQQLRTMPYKEYLQTPEWNQRRNRHLKSARFSCQVCNASNSILDVHHRTYERRGNELFTDLIVLCRNCHSLFHERSGLQ